VNAPTPIAGDPMPTKKAVLETVKGTIELELFADEVPNTVANFERLANSGFYDGTTFHRVIPGFMIQGGDPYSKTGAGRVGTGGPGYTIECETEKNVHRHVAGALSMAHAGKDTGGSQFFICHAPQPHLDGVHTVFGLVTKGMDVVRQIAQNDRITSIRVQ
jgi:peptidyl-prolyl cis-trans isomerase B (cyclophilin B)